MAGEERVERCPTCGASKPGALRPTQGCYPDSHDPWHDVGQPAPASVAQGTEQGEAQLSGEHFLNQFWDIEELTPLTPHAKTAVLAAMVAFADYRVRSASLPLRQ